MSNIPTSKLLRKLRTEKSSLERIIFDIGKAEILAEIKQYVKNVPTLKRVTLLDWIFLKEQEIEKEGEVE